MPGSANVGKNIEELKADNKKDGKEKGANGKKRGLKQIVAIALNEAREKGKNIPYPKK